MVNNDEFDDIDELLSGKYISLGPNEKKLGGSFNLPPEIKGFEPYFS